MIEFTIKTLDSVDHSMSVDNDTTVYGLKQIILEQLGIDIENQRLIFFGKVLHDSRKLSEYGVDGKVVHLVEQPPPRFAQSSNEAEDMDVPRYQFDPSGRRRRASSPTRARIQYLQRTIQEIRESLELLGQSDTWLPFPRSRQPSGNQQRSPDAGPSNDQNQGPSAPGSRRRPQNDDTSQAGPSDEGPSKARPGDGSSQTRPDKDSSQTRPDEDSSQTRPDDDDTPDEESDQAGPDEGLAQAGPSQPRASGESTRDSRRRNRDDTDWDTISDRLGRVFEPRRTVPYSQRYADLLSELLLLEAQFYRYRIMYTEWVRHFNATTSAGELTSEEIDELIRRRQNFASQITQIHHSFAHAHHVISDIYFLFTPSINRLTSDIFHPRTEDLALHAHLNVIDAFTGEFDAQEMFHENGRHRYPPHQQIYRDQFRQQMPYRYHNYPRYQPQHQQQAQRMQPMRRNMYVNPMGMPMNRHPCRIHTHGHPQPQLSNQFQYTMPRSQYAAQQLQHPAVNEYAPQQNLYPVTAQPMYTVHQPLYHAQYPYYMGQQMHYPMRQYQNQQRQYALQQPQFPAQFLQCTPEQHQQQPQRQFQAFAEMFIQHAGLPTALSFGTPQTVDINIQPNPVTFQFEVETRSLDSALLNTVANHVSQLVASQIAGESSNNPGAPNVPSTSNMSSTAVTSAPTDSSTTTATTTTQSQGQPQTGAATQATTPLPGPSIGTVHLGTFNLGTINLGTINAGGSMEGDSQGPANIVDGRGQSTSQGANDQRSQDSSNQNDGRPRHVLLDFENYFRGLEHPGSLGEIVIEMRVRDAEDRVNLLTLSPMQLPTAVVNVSGAFNQGQQDAGASTSAARRTAEEAVAAGAAANPARTSASTSNSSAPNAAASNNPHATAPNVPHAAAPNNPHAAAPNNSHAAASNEPPASAAPNNPNAAAPNEAASGQSAPQNNGAPNQIVSRQAPYRRSIVHPTSLYIYDPFLLCHSTHAHSRLIRRRQKWHSDREAREQHLQNTASQREEREENLEADNWSAIESLVRVNRPLIFTESILVAVVVAFHQATSPDSMIMLSPEEFENLRRIILIGLRRLSRTCEIESVPCTAMRLAEYILSNFASFIQRINTITPIRPHVDVHGSLHRVVTTYTPAMVALLQRTPTPNFIHSFRQLFSSLYFNLSCLLVHICRNGYEGFSSIYNAFVDNLNISIDNERNRRHIETLMQTMLPRVMDHIESNPSDPHQYVVRTDGISTCICYRGPQPNSSHSMPPPQRDTLVVIYHDDPMEAPSYYAPRHGSMADQLPRPPGVGMDPEARDDPFQEEYRDEQDYGNGQEEYGAGQEEYGDYEDGQGEYGNRQGEYEDRQGEYECGQGVYEDGEGDYEDGEGDYEDGPTEYGDTQGEYDCGHRVYEDGERAYEDEEGSYEDGEGAYEDGHPAYEVGQREYEAGQGENGNEREKEEQVPNSGRTANITTENQLMMEQVMTDDESESDLPPILGPTVRYERPLDMGITSTIQRTVRWPIVQPMYPVQNAAYMQPRYTPVYTYQNPVINSTPEQTSSRAPEPSHHPAPGWEHSPTVPEPGVIRLTPEREYSPHPSDSHAVDCPLHVPRASEPVNIPQTLPEFAPSAPELETFSDSQPEDTSPTSQSETLSQAQLETTSRASDRESVQHHPPSSLYPVISLPPPPLRGDPPTPLATESPVPCDTQSPATKRMKQESADETGAASNDTSDIRKVTLPTDSKRKFFTIRHDRAPNIKEPTTSEDSGESVGRNRMEHFPRQWVPVLEADARAPETQEPLSDAYLAGMTSRRRRRVRSARPPQDAIAFIHDCVSSATEGALENGGEAERSMFRTFFEHFRALTAESAVSSEDYRPALHVAVAKLLNHSSAQEEQNGSDQNKS